DPTPRSYRPRAGPFSLRLPTARCAHAAAGPRARARGRGRPLQSAGGNARPGAVARGRCGADVRGGAVRGARHPRGELGRYADLGRSVRPFRRIQPALCGDFRTASGGRVGPRAAPDDRTRTRLRFEPGELDRHRRRARSARERTAARDGRVDPAAHRSGEPARRRADGAARVARL
ncbi:MAG: hypothetical protein AVDCRST_MAG71-1378, partial [uncultured Lysobacter sp.]